MLPRTTRAGEGLLCRSTPTVICDVWRYIMCLQIGMARSIEALAREALERKEKPSNI
jgi:hypothetical protein